MFNIMIVAPESPSTGEMEQRLEAKGFNCIVVPDVDRAMERLKENPAHLVMLELHASEDRRLPADLLDASGREQPAIMAIVSGKELGEVAVNVELADFVISPLNVEEAEIRIRRVLQRKAGAEGGDVINFGPLSIDKASCEVRLDNQLVEMTFKEYELLLFLIKNRGRVFSRQVLLDRVWGHDYYGGDRTVDVHIRRLRSKIEETGHSFIETVRNVGYKFTREP